MANVIRASIRSELYDQELVTVLHFAQTTALAEDDPSRVGADGANAMWSRIGGSFKAMLPSLGTVRELTIVDAEDPLDPHAERFAYVKPINEAGTRGVPNTDLPLGVCGIIGWLSDRYGRRFRGRTFAPPVLSEVEMESRLLRTGTGSYLEKLQAFANDWDSDFTWGTGGLETGTPCVYSRTARSEGDPNYWARIVGATVRTNPHWLRARQR